MPTRVEKAATKKVKNKGNVDKNAALQARDRSPSLSSTNHHKGSQSASGGASTNSVGGSSNSIGGSSSRVGGSSSRVGGSSNSLGGSVSSCEDDRWQTTLQGGLSFGMSESVVLEGDKTLASERYNVKKEEKRLDKEIDKLHEEQMRICEQIKDDSNAKAVEVYERLLFKMRWADPEVSLAQQSLINDYVQHLLGPDPKRIFSGERVMRAMFAKNVGRRAEKAHGELLKLVNRIRSIILYNDGKVSDIKSALKAQESDLLKRKGARLRWLMESNVGRKDRFWTTWYFASRGMAGPLARHLKTLKKRNDEAHLKEHGGGLEGSAGWNQRLARDEDWRNGNTATSKNDVDARDPDFGLTALHYASKTSNTQVVKVLLEYGANPNIRAPDGRTALHFAAAYATRQIITLLLGYEADIDAVDNYGCSAEVLAEQNDNRPTWLVLQRWRTLVPVIPERPVTPPPETVIPEAYQSVPEDVIERMSKPLQAIARRLVPPEDMMSAAEEYMDEQQEKRKEAEWQHFRERGVSEAALATQDEVLAREKEKRRLGFTDSTVDLTDEMRWELEKAKREEEEKGNFARNKFRKGKSMSPIVELRLCQKFANMCFAEGFVDEGLRGLRRRWDSAKKLLEKTNQKRLKLHEHREAHIKNNAQVHLQRRRESLHRKLNDSTLQRPNVSPAREGEEGSESSSTIDFSSMDSLSTADEHAAGEKVSEDYTLHACVETGRELAEALIRYKQEGFGATVLEECLMLSGVPKLEQYDMKGRVDPLSMRSRSRRRIGGYLENDSSAVIPPQTNLEPSGTVALLARRCEVLLCVWDMLLKDQSETTRTLPFPPSSASEYADHYDEIRRESVQSLAETLSPSKAATMQELADRASHDYYSGVASTSSDKFILPGSAIKPGGVLEQPSLASIDEASALIPEQTQVPWGDANLSQESFHTAPIRPLEENSSAWNDSDFKLTTTAALLGVSRTSVDAPPVPHPHPSVSSVESQDFVGFGYIGRNFQLYQRILTVAVQCRDSVELAIDIVTTSSADLLVEPYMLVPLLELRAEVYEREEDYENAVVCLNRAEDCCKRSLGTYTLQTVSVMIEALRLLIKCETPEGYKAATEKANELTKVIDKIEQNRREAREEADRKKTDIFEILKERKRQKELERDRQRAFEEARTKGEPLDGSVYTDPEKMVAAVEREEDVKRLGPSGRRAGMSIAPTRPEAYEEDTSELFKKAMELVSLAKLLDCRMESMPSLGLGGVSIVHDHDDQSHGISTRSTKKQNEKVSSVGSRMSQFSVVNAALGKVNGKKGKKAAFDDSASTVYTGRAPARKDTSQTLSHATKDVIIQDGHQVLVKKGTKSASTAPHEHVERLESEGLPVASKHAGKNESGSEATHLSDSSVGGEAAVALAMAGLRASRMLSRPTYYQVPAEPRTKRVFESVLVAEEAPRSVEESSSAYFSQLQTRALTHDVTKAAILRGEQLQRELSSDLRFHEYESSFLSQTLAHEQGSRGQEACTQEDALPSSRPPKNAAREKGVKLGAYDTTLEEAVLRGGVDRSSVSAVSNRKSILPIAGPFEARGDSLAHSGASPQPVVILPVSSDSNTQREAIATDEQADIDRILKTSSASDFKPSPYDTNPMQLRAGFGSVSATASYNNSKNLSESQKLVLANVHSTVNLANKHRLEKLMESRPALAGLLSLSDRGRRGGISSADGGSNLPVGSVLVERDSSLACDSDERLSTSHESLFPHSPLKTVTGSAEDDDEAGRQDAVDAEQYKLSVKSTGSILHTGSAVVSIPHTKHAVAVSPHTRKIPNKEASARAVSAAIALGEEAGLIASREPITKPRGRDLSSRKYSDKYTSGDTDTPLMRYRDGEWKVERQSEQQASQEMKTTSLVSLSRSIRDIEEERERLHPDTSFYL